MLRKLMVIIVISFCLSSCQANQKGYSSDYQKLNSTSLDQTRLLAKGTHSYFIAHGKDETIRIAIESVKQKLSDPYSAQFENIRLANFEGLTVVCGQVNAKNKLGGYTGFTDFVSGVAVIFYKKHELPEVERERNAGIIT